MNKPELFYDTRKDKLVLFREFPRKVWFRYSEKDQVWWGVCLSPYECDFVRVGWL